jgi:hypothetical protein
VQPRYGYADGSELGIDLILGGLDATAPRPDPASKRRETKVSLLNPPAAIDDFDRRPDLRDGLARGWDTWLRRWIDDGARWAAREDGRFRAPDPGDDALVRQAIAWDAFPRAITRWYRDDDKPDEARWRVSEVLRPRLYGKTASGDPVHVLERQQDEYCEWFVRRDRKRRITRVDFTSEGPEYWLFLAHGSEVLYRELEDPPRFRCDGDLGLVVELYREHVSGRVREADLVWKEDVFVRDSRGGWRLGHRKGEYDPYNKWNTTHGAMHLTHRSNTLSAEILLGAEATVLRANRDAPVTDIDALICCSGYGNPNRSSDPSIGATVNGFARAGYAVSIADPIGLYISELDHDAFAGPDGEDVSDAWLVDRGSEDLILRAHFGPSKGSGLRVDEMLADRRPIQSGAQIADAIQMVLVGEVGDTATPSPSHPCGLRCCDHPDDRPVRTIVEDGERCDSIDWAGLAPFDGPSPGRAAPTRRAAPADADYPVAAHRRTG